jgi:small subunit ribosomal protein S9
MGVIHKIGRRKTAVACLCFGRNRSNHCKQKNLQLISGYFTVQSYATNLWQRTTNFDVKVNVYGGGSTGQAEAVRMALARAMCEVNAENRLVWNQKVYWQEIQEWLNVRNSVRRKLVRNFNSRNV